MNRPVGWTIEEDATLKRMADGGASAGDIGIALNKSRNAVCGRAWRLGLTLHGAKKPGGKVRLRKAQPRPVGVKKIKLAPRVQPTALPLAEALPMTVEAPLPVNAVSWADLRDDCCKWPVGSMFCGAKAMPRKPYCPQHTYESRQTVSPPRGARKPTPRYW